MRTIAIEEHFLAKGFREVLQSNASSPAGVLNPMMTAERQIKLADLDTLRLQDMDTSGIDLQVISGIGATIAPRAAKARDSWSCHRGMSANRW